MARTYAVSTLEASGAAAVAFSADQKTLYVALRSGLVEAFDLVTGARTASWRVNASLGGISVSQDGSFLLVTERATGTVAAANVYKVATATGEVVRYSFSAGNTDITAFRDVEIVDGQYAILTGGGPVPLRLDLPTGEFTPIANAVSYSNSSVLVEDRHLTLFAEPGISNGPLKLYDDRLGRIVAQGDTYQANSTNGGSTGFNWGSQAVSEAAGLVVQYSYSGRLNVYDLQLKMLRGVGIPGDVDGLAFDRSGRFLYAYLIGTGEVVKLEVAGWTIVERFAVSTSQWHNNVGYGTQLSISDDGRYLVVADTSDRGSVQLVKLSAPTPGTPSQTLELTEPGGTVSNNDTLTGTPGVRIGAANAHFINSGVIAPSGSGLSVEFAATGAVVTNLAGGTIGHTFNYTAIQGSSGADTVLNAGRIIGTVYLGDGNDLFIDQGGSVEGAGRGINLEGGDDALRFDGALNRSFFASGGDGFDTVTVTGPGRDGQGGGLFGFERLVLEHAGNFQRFSGYQQISLGTGDTFSFLDSSNPLVDLTLAGQSLSLPRSSLRSVTGTTATEWLYLLDGGSVGDVRLGGGNDVVEFDSFQAYLTGRPGTVTGALDGGPGSDTLSVVAGAGITVRHDFALAAGFETLAVNRNYSYLTGTVTVANLSGVTSVRVGAMTTLTLETSSLAGATVAGAFGGRLVIGAGTTIGSYQGNPALAPSPDGQGDARFSTTLVNAGRINGDVVLHVGNDVFDGSAGSVGGTVYGGGGDDRLIGSAGDDRFNGGAGNDLLDGGAGLDTAVFSGVRSGYRLTYMGGDAARVSGPDGTDVLTGIERLQFADGTVAVPTKLFDPMIQATSSFGAGNAAGGWNSANAYPRALADVNGDGRADVVGFGEAGTYVALGRGDGTFGNPTLAVREFGTTPGAGGWASQDRYPRTLADVNGDGRADVVGFGEAGTYVALAKADGTFGDLTLAVREFGAGAGAGGWTNQDRYPRALADVNGDGRADVVGFGEAGTYVALGQADGTFGTLFLATKDFGAALGAGGWESQDRYPRVLADVNGDGRADIVGFGNAGAYVALGRSDGTFGDLSLATKAFGAAADAGGWTSQTQYARAAADVNGDGLPDLVGFGIMGTYVAVSDGKGGFGQPILATAAFGTDASVGGWVDGDLYPRMLADVDGDKRADIVGFGENGMYLATAAAFDPVATGAGAAVDLPAEANPAFAIGAAFVHGDAPADLPLMAVLPMLETPLLAIA